MDLYSRKIIGYAYGTSMPTELELEAIKNACLNVKHTEGIILHSDLGSQYTSNLFENSQINIKTIKKVVFKKSTQFH